MSDADRPALVLVGPPGAGKSTVGALLAERLGVAFADVDELIVERAGRSIADIFTTDVCALPAAGVVAEAVVALVLADAALEKFGGDSLPETVRNLHGYLDSH